MTKIIFIISFIISFLPSFAQREPIFSISPHYDEQIYSFTFNDDVFVHINIPSAGKFDLNKKTLISLYALANGNTIDQTIGQIIGPGDDWHFDIQHIGAQTRFLRSNFDKYNFITVYLENSKKSWPAWSRDNEDFKSLTSQLVDSIKSIFNKYNPAFILTGHSGGGRFIFNFLDCYEAIPEFIKRISFLDSNYGYNDSYGKKIVNWLNNSDDNYLCVLAYNDSVALYNGKPFVSDTGGTWYKSRIMKDYLNIYFEFSCESDSNFINYSALNGRIKFNLKKNPRREIYHTVQVERNGYIHSMLTGTSLEEVGYKYYGERVYSKFIQNYIPAIRKLTFPVRDKNAIGGKQFMDSIKNMSFEEREDKIYQEITAGNFPNFLRIPIQLKAELNDANGLVHTVYYQCMPDYLSVGSDEDYYRIPMSPKTAQRIADKFAMTLPTNNLVDNIYYNSTQKLEPVTYPWSEGLSETVFRFAQHSASIDSQLSINRAIKGELVSGIKKDIIISKLLNDSSRVNNVIIYGWHKNNDRPIQNITNIHSEKYVDYSHGIRLINSEVILDGSLIEINKVLQDNILYKVLSNEDGPMKKTSYLD